ncbi:MAG: T9SS type A sorting domain-containing protein [Bacteroidota bacterium]
MRFRLMILVSFVSHLSYSQASYNLCSLGSLSIVRDSSGNFYDSGGLIGDYQPNESCALLILPSCASTIVMTFNTFSVETLYDTLYIYDGLDASAPLIATLTGLNLSPPPVTAYSGSMYCYFVSDFLEESSGWSASWNATTISSSSPSAAFSIDSLYFPFNSKAHFTDLSSGNPDGWSWDFGDGGTSIEQNPEHTYSASGTFIVRLVSFACSLSDTAYNTLIVQSPPIASVQPDTILLNLSCGDTVSFQITIVNQGAGDLVYSINGTNGIHLLAMKYGISFGFLYANTIASINSFFTNYFLTETDSVNPEIIDSLLDINNALLLPTQDAGDPAVMSRLAPIFQNFLRRGGTIIQCGESPGPDTCINASGLWNGDFIIDANVTSNYLDIDSLNHPILNGLISSSFRPPSASYVRHMFNPDKHTLVSFLGNDAVAVRYVEGGKNVYLAFDYYQPVYETRKIISNVVQWSGEGTFFPLWLAMSTSGGIISPGDSEMINLSIAASYFSPGDHEVVFYILTNDTSAHAIRIVCELNISGNFPNPSVCIPRTIDSSSTTSGIFNVSLGNINRSSTGADNGYEDFSCTDSTTLIAGSTNSFTVTTGTAMRESVGAWIDFDNSGDFSSVEISFRDSSVLTNHSGIITLPSNSVFNMPLRMRVGSEATGLPVPNGCSDVLHGQYEDYMVYITPQDNLSEHFPEMMTVIPNPFHETFHLAFKNSSEGKCMMKILDTSGREVIRKFIRNEDQSLDLSELQNGIYFLQLQTEGNSFFQKLVKL